MVKKLVIKSKNERDIIVYVNQETINILHDVLNGNKSLEDICFPLKGIIQELVSAHKNRRLFGL